MGTPAMRWLLVKDLQILRRSPLITALLVIYPIVIAVLVGFALSRGPDKPRVAFLNEVPKGSTFSVGTSDLDENQALYGERWTSKQILGSGAKMPEAASKLIAVLNKYSMRASK